MLTSLNTHIHTYFIQKKNMKLNIYSAMTGLYSFLSTFVTLSEFSGIGNICRWLLPFKGGHHRLCRTHGLHDTKRCRFPSKWHRVDIQESCHLKCVTFPLIIHNLCDENRNWCGYEIAIKILLFFIAEFCNDFLQCNCRRETNF